MITHIVKKASGRCPNKNTVHVNSSVGVSYSVGVFFNSSCYAIVTIDILKNKPITKYVEK